MTCIDKILDMLDWNAPNEVQARGIELANSISDLSVLMQPTAERHNKNIWKNCAIILSRKSDAELIPFLPRLFEWIQDMNWPGAAMIFSRLSHFGEKSPLIEAYLKSVQQAQDSNDEIWLENLQTSRSGVHWPAP